MAELYLAKDTRKDRLVVIKRILPYLAQEREFVQMFLDEARIASQLHHPNIITVYELGQLEGSIFIAMEYVEGVDLRKIFNEEQKRQGVVPANITAWLVSRLCDGLHYAHNRVGTDGKPLQIIHRDVSPQNLMVGYGGQVKLVDFGIAKAGAFMERSKPGVIKGKFLYLSPEQLSQERIDHRADIFALGTMMYEISTGKSPFYKATTEAVIYAIRAEEPPPPHLTRRDFPMGLSKIIMRCLVKDRSRRYQQAGEVHADLEAWMRAEGKTSIDDVRAYVSRLFGSDDERTSLFIPANARGPSDRMTDRVAAVKTPGAQTIPARGGPDRTVKAPPPRGPPPMPPVVMGTPINDETTRPMAPLLEGSSAPSGITNAASAVTAPVGRRPTPPTGQRAQTPAAPARMPTGQQRPVNAAKSSGPQQRYDPAPDPRTQTARPQDLAKAFTVTPPPQRRASAEGLRSAGADDIDATALSGSGRLMTGDSLPSFTPSLQSNSGRTPSTVENGVPVKARPTNNASRIPEGLRETKLPPEPQPRPRTSTSQQQARKQTRGESAAVFEVPQQFARDEIGRPPPPTVVPTLPPEPPTREDRRGAAARSRPSSSDDLGPLLDQAIPQLNNRAQATFDQDDQENTQDLKGRAGISQLGESQEVSASGSMPDDGPSMPPAQREDTAADDPPGGIADRPWLVAMLVFVVVLVLGLGGLAAYRVRQSKLANATRVDKPVVKPDVPPVKTDTPPVKPDAPPVKPDAPTVKTDVPPAKNDGAPTPPPGTKTDDPAPVPTPTPTPTPSTEVDETQTVLVRFVAPAGTRLVDQRDNNNLSPNTGYRWSPGRHPITYRCPKKGRLQAPDVTYNVDVKVGVAEQSFPISCK